MATKTDKTGATKGREVVYPNLMVNGIEIPEDALTITEEQAKEYLGWEEYDDKPEEDEEYVSEIYTLIGKYVVLNNNEGNRYLTTSWLRKLMQEHLNGKWVFNGESMVIGKTGLTISAQHRLVSFVCACHERQNGKNAAHWKKVNKKPLTMQSIVVTGVSEDDNTFKTLNQGKPGTLSEVLFRSDHLEGLPYTQNQKKQLARHITSAVKLLWHRTGEVDDPYSTHCTHGEAFDFLNRHPKIVDVVCQLYDEDEEKAISGYHNLGECAGITYLMACSDADEDTYNDKAKKNGGPRSAKRIDNLEDNLDKAMEFWVELSKGMDSVLRESVLTTPYPVTGDDEDKWSGIVFSKAPASRVERLSVLCRAWNMVKEQKFKWNKLKMTGDDLALEYDTTDLEEGEAFLESDELVGGIDMGFKRIEEEPEEPEEKQEEEDVPDMPLGHTDDEEEPDEMEFLPIDPEKVAERARQIRERVEAATQ